MGEEEEEEEEEGEKCVRAFMRQLQFFCVASLQICTLKFIRKNLSRHLLFVASR